MFLNFYKEPGKDAERLANTFAEEVIKTNRNVSPAQIQGFFLFHKNNPEKVLENVNQIWEITWKFRV